MGKPTVAAPPPWHALSAEAAARALEVLPDTGLSPTEVTQRQQRYGPNRLAEARREPRWRAFLRQFQDLMIVILLVAAAVSAVVSKEWETPVAIAVVVLLNALIGFVQESRAEASLDALKQLSVSTAVVRRNRTTMRVNADDLVPGDVVILEAGDRVPADGRLLSAKSLQIQESGLTGEAQPVGKTALANVPPDAALGDRVTAVFMTTAVTRGRGEFLVTTTGMATETGRIAGMLASTERERTPLQRQIDGLSRTLAGIAGVVIAVVSVVGAVRGQDFATLFVSAVSLAVAAIPEGLPAVVAFTLAMGAGRLARRGAIVKRLASVETLGSTSQICTDKTGTLTLNEMTAREFLLAGRRFTVSGEGYRTEGRIRTTDGAPVPSTVDLPLLAMALSSDAVIRDGQLVGDPTEGALVVLAEKGGIDVNRLREERPRLLEVPFDSEYKYSATFHRWPDAGGTDIVRCFLKGAPDVLAALADRHLSGSAVLPFDAATRERYSRANAELASQGMRVLAIGSEDFPIEGFSPPEDPKQLLDRVVLLALVGIVDPPRPQARQAIAECRDAGIRVRMITGDHAVTAAAIAGELGIPGKAVTGADLDLLDDDALGLELGRVGVVARVSPAHKLRIVRVLQDGGDVVAMTGDGVNDAPALGKADIGVAMGVTGTEVTKEAASMVLTDDNFATIVRAVREGRGIYDNIVKFTRFQVSTALQILFVNLIMDGPPAMSLGVDPVSSDAMTRPPRPSRDRILTRPRLLRIVLASAVMAAGTLAVLIWAPGPEPRLGQATPAGTMAFATFVFFQAFNLLNVRHDLRSVFRRETLENRTAFLATGVVVVVLVLVVELSALQSFFTTTSLTSDQWLVCAAVGSSILWEGELLKAALRYRARRR